MTKGTKTLQTYRLASYTRVNPVSPRSIDKVDVWLQTMGSSPQRSFDLDNDNSHSQEQPESDSKSSAMPPRQMRRVFTKPSSSEPAAGSSVSKKTRKDEDPAEHRKILQKAGIDILEYLSKRMITWLNENIPGIDSEDYLGLTAKEFFALKEPQITPAGQDHIETTGKRRSTAVRERQKDSTCKDIEAPAKNVKKASMLEHQRSSTPELQSMSSGEHTSHSSLSSKGGTHSTEGRTNSTEGRESTLFNTLSMSVMRQSATVRLRNQCIKETARKLVEDSRKHVSDFGDQEADWRWIFENALGRLADKTGLAVKIERNDIAYPAFRHATRLSSIRTRTYELRARIVDVTVRLHQTAFKDQNETWNLLESLRDQKKVFSCPKDIYFPALIVEAKCCATRNSVYMAENQAAVASACLLWDLETFCQLPRKQDHKTAQPDPPATPLRTRSPAFEDDRGLSHVCFSVATENQHCTLYVHYIEYDRMHEPRYIMAELASFSAGVLKSARRLVTGLKAIID
ncbi:MAG: hypothetical protein M1819_002108 [Sarea resinae]|nr:MAG: hypothetical protein M1819_002108 [Sarea resinae]